MKKKRIMAVIMALYAMLNIQGAEEKGMMNAAAAGEINSFSIREGNNDNYFLSAPGVSCHVVIAGSASPRILVAFPAGNAGSALWFDPGKGLNENLSLTLDGAIEPCEEANAVKFRIRAGKRKIALTHYVLDSIRQIRNHGTAEEDKVDRTWKAMTDMPGSHVNLCVTGPIEALKAGRAIVLKRGTVKGKDYRLTLVPGPDVTVCEGLRGSIVLESPEEVTFTVHCSVPFAPLTCYDSRTLFSARAHAFREVLLQKARAPGASLREKERAARFDEAFRNLSFLSFREKYCAGSWRFLTYFGRDTLISLMMLQHVVSTGAYTDGIESVLTRLSPEGSVAHEEDIGSWAEYRHGLEGLKKGHIPSDAEKPVYDYKMVDDKFLLPVMVSRYMQDCSVPAGEKRAFLEHAGLSGEKNITLLLRNFNYVLGMAEPGARDGSAVMSADNLIAISKGEAAGNWRDSCEGLGRGIYPLDVNGELVPQALAAIDVAVRSGLYGLEELRLQAEKDRLLHLLPMLDPRNPGRIREWGKSWRRARPLFIVSLSPREVRNRVNAYMESLQPEERRCLLAEKIEKDMTLDDFLHREKIPVLLKDGLAFSALSLNRDGTPVEVENSDFVFTLFLGEPDERELLSILKLVELPYPLGLSTDVGMIVANPALSRQHVHWKTLDRRAYHGTVIWSWQMYMLELGLVRQIDRFSGKGGCQSLVDRMKGTLRAVRESREHVGAFANSELWSFSIKEGKMVPMAFGAEAGSEDESNAVQLWSTVVPAVIMEESRTLGE